MLGAVTQKQAHQAAQESEQIKGLINQDERVFFRTPSQMPSGFSLTPLNTSLPLYSQLSVIRRIRCIGPLERESYDPSFLRLRLYLKLSTLFWVYYLI